MKVSDNSRSARLYAMGALGSIALLYLLGYYWPQFDYLVLQQIAAYKTPGIDQAALWITQFGTTDILFPATIILALILVRFNWRFSCFVLLTMATSALVMRSIKFLTARIRPDVEWAAYEAGGYSFPSGHASASLTFALILSLVLNQLVPNLKNTVLGRFALLLPVGSALLIGLTRPYLGVHFPTDVAAAWVLAIGIVVVLDGVFSRRFH